MTLQLSTCICLVFLVIVISFGKTAANDNDTVADQITARCTERIGKANLPPVVTNSFCCMGIIRCFCFVSLCKSETAKADVFCNVTVNVRCGSVGIGSRCKEALKDFAAFCAGADAHCAADDNVHPYVSSTSVYTAVNSTGSSLSVGLIVGIVGAAFLVLLLTIAFVCIFCRRDSKSKSVQASTSNASKSSLKVASKQNSVQSSSAVAGSKAGAKSSN